MSLNSTPVCVIRTPADNTPAPAVSCVLSHGGGGPNPRPRVARMQRNRVWALTVAEIEGPPPAGASVSTPAVKLDTVAAGWSAGATGKAWLAFRMPFAVSWWFASAAVGRASARMTPPSAGRIDRFMCSPSGRVRPVGMESQPRSRP